MSMNADHLSCKDENGSIIFEDTSFSIGNGSRTAVLSEDLFAASILCHSISGILPRTHPVYRLAGNVRIGREDLFSLTIQARVNRITYVPEHSELLLSGVKDSVFGEVALSLELRGHEPEAIGAAVDTTLKNLGIDSLRERSPEELSGGERQKVALASVFVSQPEILVLDNPSLYLDGEGIRSLISIIRDYRGTVIISDPNPLLWAAVVDGFLLMVRNRFIPCGMKEFIDKALSAHSAIELPPWLDTLNRLRGKNIPVDLPASTVAADSIAILSGVVR